MTRKVIRQSVRSPLKQRRLKLTLYRERQTKSNNMGSPKMIFGGPKLPRNMIFGGPRLVPK